MRILAAGAVSALFLMGQAFAQTEIEAPTAPEMLPAAAVELPPNCGAFSEAPSVPDGASATRQQIDEANTAYTAWGNTTITTLNCIRDEVSALRAREQALVELYNGKKQDLDQTTAAMEAAVTAFNARPQRRGR